MPFFKRAKKADQVADPPLDGSNAAVPQAAANPGVDGEGEGEKNAMALARTRTEDIVYPKGIKLALLMTSVFVSMFLVALVCGLPIIFLPCHLLPTSPFALDLVANMIASGSTDHLDSHPADYR